MRSDKRSSLLSRWLQPAASAIAMLLCVGAAWSQSNTATGPTATATAGTTANTAPDTAVASGLRWHWATSAGMNTYNELTNRGPMRLQGPELGLHLRLSDISWGGHWGLEADVLYGRQGYESEQTGSKTDIPNIETRSRIMYSHTGQRTAGPSLGLSYGLAFHTLWNNLQGPTTTGHGGYLRKAFQLWVPVRWREGMAPGAWATAWTAEGGILLSGQHISMLSQVDSLNFVDVTNRQNRGLYLQFSSEHRQGLRAGAWSPYVRFSWLGDSDEVPFSRIDQREGIEPMSRRWQVGAQWLLP